ncbi:MAG: hypothetical protein ACD_4C00351G0002 [uncultured bacterium (gcode 4)]|uniref:Uncharacterized protein n=1 Tax=uncultured bacterium (gcode 4) TaxID=1234023 RepID=K2G852_9BACT|nr:MAG: hypothetical protein ACD_4C00351G0002 [uncultured bacterium (gcode 4)]
MELNISLDDNSAYNLITRDFLLHSEWQTVLIANNDLINYYTTKLVAPSHARLKIAFCELA